MQSRPPLQPAESSSIIDFPAGFVLPSRPLYLAFFLSFRSSQRSITLQRLTSLRRRAQANAPAAPYWLRRLCLSVFVVSWSSIDTDERIELISDRYVLRLLFFSRFPFLTNYFNQFLNVLGYLW